MEVFNNKGNAVDVDYAQLFAKKCNSNERR